MIPGSISGDGCMSLLEVVRIYNKAQPYGSYYKIVFKKGVLLAVTALHAFRIAGMARIAKCVPELKNGDQIWVDTVAFVKDGSLYIPKGCEQLNRNLGKSTETCR